MDKTGVRLGLALSTTGERFDQLHELISSSSSELSQFDQAVIVVQMPLEDSKKLVEDLWAGSGITVPLEVVIDPLAGLSRSRNQAISRLDSDYVWTLDDDVEIADGAVYRIKKYLASQRPDVLCGRTRCKNIPAPYRKYPNRQILNRINFIRVSSIEIIVSESFLKTHKISYRESMGLGARYPSGEENILLLDIHRSGGHIHHFPETIVRHPCLESRRLSSWRDPSALIAKGVIARRIGVPFGLFILIRWSARLVVSGLPITYVRFLVKGFLWPGLIDED